jgi:hypothetical protein
MPQASKSDMEVIFFILVNYNFILIKENGYNFKNFVYNFLLLNAMFKTVRNIIIGLLGIYLGSLILQMRISTAYLWMVTYGAFLLFNGGVLYLFYLQHQKFMPDSEQLRWLFISCLLISGLTFLLHHVEWVLRIQQVLFAGYLLNLVILLALISFVLLIFYTAKAGYLNFPPLSVIFLMLICGFILYQSSQIKAAHQKMLKQYQQQQQSSSKQ